MALTDSTNPMQGVSGPGKFAKRTDLEYQSTAYGEGVAMDALKAGAPLAKAQPTPRATPTDVRQAAMQNPLTELYAPTQRPDEPITAGVNTGEGPGSEALMLSQIRQTDKDIVAKYLPSLTSMAAQQDTPQSFRAFVSYLQGSL